MTARAIGSDHQAAAAPAASRMMSVSCGVYATDDRAQCDYDVILDVGGNTPVARLRKVLARTGTLVIVGGETDGRLLGGVQRQLGASLLSPFVRQRLGTFVCKENAADLAVLTGLIDAGKVIPAVDQVLPLTSATKALQLLLDGAVRGKLVLAVSSGGAEQDS